jgi:protein SCO1/2
MTLPTVRLTMLAVAGFAVGAMTALTVLPQARERLMPGGGFGGNVRVSGEASIGGPFTLSDLTGKTVTDADFRGRTMVVVFASAAAPDIAAAALQVLSAALAKLGPKAQRVAPILVIVDGGGQAPEHLKRLVEGFDPRLVGLTGTHEQIARVLAAYRVPGIREREDTVSLGRYAISYPPPMYVMGPDGRYRGHLAFAAGADAVAASLAGML